MKLAVFMLVILISSVVFAEEFGKVDIGICGTLTPAMLARLRTEYPHCIAPRAWGCAWRGASALSGGGSSYCWFLDPSTFVIVDATRGQKRADLIEWMPLHELDQQTAKVGFMRAHLAIFCVERRRNGLFFDGPAS